MHVDRRKCSTVSLCGTDCSNKSTSSISWSSWLAWPSSPCSPRQPGIAAGSGRKTLWTRWYHGVGGWVLCTQIDTCSWTLASRAIPLRPNDKVSVPHCLVGTMIHLFGQLAFGINCFFFMSELLLFFFFFGGTNVFNKKKYNMDHFTPDALTRVQKIGWMLGKLYLLAWVTKKRNPSSCLIFDTDKKIRLTHWFVFFFFEAYNILS